MYSFFVYRNCDTLRLRKIVIELYRDQVLVHKTRMFLRPTLRGTMRAIRRRKAWMLALAEAMAAESGKL